MEMMDAELWQEVSTIGTWCGVGLVFVGTTATVLIAHGRTGKRLEAVEKTSDHAMERIEKHERECMAYRAEAAEKYASTKMIERLEERVFEALRQVGDRIDLGLTRLGDRLDKVLDNRHGGISDAPSAPLPAALHRGDPPQSLAHAHGTGGDTSAGAVAHAPSLLPRLSGRTQPRTAQRA